MPPLGRIGRTRGWWWSIIPWFLEELALGGVPLDFHEFFCCAMRTFSIDKPAPSDRLHWNVEHGIRGWCFDHDFIAWNASKHIRNHWTSYWPATVDEACRKNDGFMIGQDQKHTCFCWAWFWFHCAQLCRAFFWVISGHTITWNMKLGMICQRNDHTHRIHVWYIYIKIDQM